MPGPAPKNPSERRRRNAAPELMGLPSGGRDGEAPKWPLSRAKKAEIEVWAELWRTPQAVAWERLGWTRVVARYVRLVVEAEQPGAQGIVMSEARQLEDRLGLTPMAMLRLRWEIRPDEVAEARGAAAPSVRRLRAVDPSSSAG